MLGSFDGWRVLTSWVGWLGIIPIPLFFFCTTLFFSCVYHTFCTWPPHVPWFEPCAMHEAWAMHEPRERGPWWLEDVRTFSSFSYTRIVPDVHYSLPGSIAGVRITPTIFVLVNTPILPLPLPLLELAASWLTTSNINCRLPCFFCSWPQVL